MRTLLFIPAYNASKTIKTVIRRIPKDVYSEVTKILIQDDASKDDTYEIAAEMALQYTKIIVVRNSVNLGYGGTKKKAYKYGLSEGYDIIIMIHGDCQHPPEFLPELMAPLKAGQSDIVLGSRMLGKPLAGGMPFWKWLGNRFLTGLANIGLGVQLTDYHTGFRGYTTSALARLKPATCLDGHEISFQLLYRGISAGLRVLEVPVPTFYGHGSRAISFQTSVRYGLFVTRQMVPMIFSRCKPVLLS